MLICVHYRTGYRQGRWWKVVEEPEKVSVERQQRRASVRRSEKKKKIPLKRNNSSLHCYWIILIKSCWLQWKNIYLGTWKFTCDKCNSKFDTKYSFKLHKSKMHKENQSPNKKSGDINFNENLDAHSCEECDLMLKEKHDL